jgi:hypothetical protein
LVEFLRLSILAALELTITKVIMLINFISCESMLNMIYLIGTYKYASKYEALVTVTSTGGPETVTKTVHVNMMLHRKCKLP